MPRFPVCALVAGALVAASAPTARADKIDAALHKQAPAILAALKKADVKTVGTLRFRADRGKRLDNFDVGPINDAMAARLESLLVIHADRDNPIAVLKDPGTVAAAAKLGPWYTSPAARRKLFEHEFPTAWGNKKAKADAFLSGEVRCTGDMTKTTVVVEMFTAADPTKMAKVIEFTVPTDRLILADLGERFRVAPRGGVRRSIDADMLAIGEVRARENGDTLEGEGPGGGKPVPNPDVKPPADGLDVGGVTYRLFAGDQPVAFRPATSASAKWEVVSPAADQAVTMRLKNTTAKRVGVVLKVNEVNTIFMQTEDAALCRKWVIEPGKEITLKGFYREDKQVAPFKVLVGDEAKAMIDQLGEKAGRIRVEVFEEAAAEADAAPADRGLPRRIPEAKLAASRRSLDSLSTALRTPAWKTVTKTETVNGKALKREIIVPDEASLTTGPDLKVAEDYTPAGSPIAAELIQIVKQ